VEGALAEVRRLQGQARWGEAQAVLDQAQSRLGDGGPHDLKDRLARAQAELLLVKRLDDVRLKRATTVEGHFDFAGADRGYEDAFRAAGMAGVGGETAAAADWVHGTAVQEALVAALDDWAVSVVGRRRAWVLEVARRTDPDPWRDRVRDPAAWDNPAELARRVAAEQGTGQSPQLLVALGTRLSGKEEEQLLKRAQERHPGDFWVNFALGNSAHEGKNLEEAVIWYRVALALRPGTAAVHNNLGNALSDQHKVAEAIAEYKKAIAIDPKYAYPHNNLGNALRAQGQVAEAIAEFQKAIALAPRYAPSHNNLGNLLFKKHKPDEAEAEFRKAIELGPSLSQPHSNLGGVLKARGRRDEALAEFRKAVALDPRDVRAHFNIGATLREAGRGAEALAAFRKAVEVNPRIPEVHHGLGLALMEQGQFAEARQALQRCLDLLPGFQARSMAIRLVLRECEQQAALEQKLAAVLAGRSRPADAAEQVALAGLCVLQKRYAAAARLYADAFTERPALAASYHPRLTDWGVPEAGAAAVRPRLATHRGEATRAALLAAAGRGVDATQIAEKERAALRRQALGWLREDLALWGRQVDGGTAGQRADVRQSLRRWQEDADLAGVREAAALDRLPEAERAEWKKLWTDGEALRKKTGGDGKP
jgi:tetratricopeptide (TPR) repeat protein